MIDPALRAQLGDDPEIVFRRSQRAYGKAYQQSAAPSWAKHPLPHLTERFVFDLQQNAAAPRVLDIGCGDGAKAEMLATLGLDVVGIDYEVAAIRRAEKRLSSDQQRLTFLRGDVRHLGEVFPDNEFAGVFDYQCLSSIPPEFWPDVQRGLYTIIKPGGLLLIDLPSLDSEEFHGPIAHRLAGSHDLVFAYDPQESAHRGLHWEHGLYLYLFDAREAAGLFSDSFDLMLLERGLHPHSTRRVLWTALMRSKKAREVIDHEVIDQW